MEHVMTEEVRKKLLGLTSFDTGCTYPFTPKAFLAKVKDADGKDTDEFEIPETYRPVFDIRPFTKSEMKDYKSKFANVDKVKDEDLYELGRKVVRGWKTWWDAGTMKPIEFEGDENGNPTKELWDKYPYNALPDLLYFAAKISGLVPAEHLGLE